MERSYRGRYINLKESKERRSEVEKVLNTLGIINRYSRFPAIKGDPKEAQDRKITSGALGLWQSWLGLLNEEKNNIENGEDYLHIIEDDCIISRALCKSIEKNAHYYDHFDIIVTDMYVNPSVYRVISERVFQAKNKSEISILENVYSGCTSSIIIKNGKINKILSVLESYYQESKNIIPIDNFIRKCSKENTLKIGTTIPFLSTVRLDKINQSTIQAKKIKQNNIDKTQEFCTLLRQDLSIFKDNNNSSEIIDIYYQLKRNRKNTTESKDTAVIKLILNELIRENLLEYKYQPNLKGEADNEQDEV